MTTTRTRGKTPFIPVTETEQSAFCQTESELRSKPLVEELAVNVRWQRVPTEYHRLTAEELDERIRRARATLGERLVILGHHYQRDEVIRYADFRGDSFNLSRYAARQEKADSIVFCGVHFMAETARILCQPRQRVILPNMSAGCSMADMAPTDDVMDAWDDLVSVVGENGITPVTYMNSTAAIKALCGANGGIVCTSSNARAVMEWAFERRPRLLFLPDQHLGRNTAYKMGVPLDAMVLWNPFKPLGGLTPDRVRNARVILWQGHCSVHTRFTKKLVDQARARHPGVRILVHPECPFDTVQAADYVGSTEYITKMVREAEPGTAWGIGTEVSLVNRIAQENPGKTVFCLDPIVCPCSTMYRIHPAYVAWVLEGLVRGEVVNEITVEPRTAADALTALERMLAVA